jgi:two-component system nitrate/nitrite response regulator NarL
VLAARAGDRDLLSEELLSVKTSGVVDPVVIARRGSAELSAAMDDLPVLDIGAGATMTNHPSASTITGHVLSSLTKRELEVLSLLRLGKTNREIAAKLVIEEVTAKVHVRHILRKLHVRSRTEAAVLAIRLASDGATPETTVFRDDPR